MRSGFCTTKYSERQPGKKRLKVQNPSQKLACIHWRCCCVFDKTVGELSTMSYSFWPNNHDRLLCIWKISGFLEKDIIFHHYNDTWPSIDTVKTATHHIFHILHLQIFICSEEVVENHLINFFEGKPISFFKNETVNLVDCWKTIVEKNGDYITE